MATVIINDYNKYREYYEVGDTSYGTFTYSPEFIRWINDMTDYNPVQIPLLFRKLIQKITTCIKPDIPSDKIPLVLHGKTKLSMLYVKVIEVDECLYIEFIGADSNFIDIQLD